MGRLQRLERRRRVTAPDGRVWTVRRRVVPRAPRWVGWGFSLRPFRTEARATFGWGRYWSWIAVTIAVLMFGFVSSLVLIGLAVVALLVLWSFVVPLVVWVLDAVLVACMAGGELAGHALLHTPWTVEATDDVHPGRGFDRGAHRWTVVGGTASAEAVDAVAARIAAGAPIRLPATAGRPVV